MMSVLGMSKGKRAHRFIPMDKADYFYPDGRTDAYTVIDINIMEGRQKGTIKQLIKLIFQKIEEDLFISNIDIEIVVNEQPAHCWGFRWITGDKAKDLSYKVQVYKDFCFSLTPNFVVVALYC